MGKREEILHDLLEHARHLETLTDIGLPRRARTAAASSASTPSPAPASLATPPAPALVIASSGPAPDSGPATLEAVREWIGDCRRCKLAGGRKTIVFGQGNPNADLMFVGEAPGAEEDEQGLAFVGRAGQLLTRIIEAIGLQRSDVFIANVLKCLRYNTLVCLENGGWERIGRLVSSRYQGKVMSVDADGRLMAKRVIGWYRSPLANRRVFRLSYVSSALRGGNRAITWLTEDHSVLTSRGWIEAANLRCDDEVAIGFGLSPIAQEVVTGSLLGDGTINRRSSFLAIIHCRAQEEYLRLKAQALTELRPIVHEGQSTARSGGPKYPTIVCRTRATRALRVIRRQFYAEGGKQVPRGLRLTPRILAIWFLDDGYTKVKSEANALSEIAGHSFTPSDIEFLVGRLAVDLGIAGYVRPGCPGRIQFGSEATRRLSEIVAPFCPPSMRYKLHPQVRDRVAFDPSLYEPNEPRTVFDRVVITPVDFKGADRTFFCIDVEDTHNFVTSGGVVHNCRPPNNRNPEPDEILSCQPFLERQIEVIKPKVLVGLGKFGGQWLLKTAAPISRIRGRVGDYNGIKVVPTYHPAFLLRNPSAKKEVWEDMKLVRSLLQE